MNMVLMHRIVLLLFLGNSLALQMALAQTASVKPLSIIYWLLVLPALVAPLFFWREMIEAVKGRGAYLLAFLFLAGSYHVLRGDFRATLQLVLLIWVALWCICPSVRLSVGDVINGFIISVIVGICFYQSTDVNFWGIVPGTTMGDNGPWRVSYFPNIANTGFAGLFVLFVLTRSKDLPRTHVIAFSICLYFLLLSFVRAAVIAAVLYVVLRLLLERVKTPAGLFWTTLAVTVGFHLAVVFVVPLLELLQQYPVMSRLLLRGYSELDTTAIYQQLYRPWVWSEHIKMFLASPHLMGLGTFRFLDKVSYILVPNLEGDGTESLLTRLIATYGLPALLLVAFLVDALYRLARNRDVWACACFPAIIFMMSNWGSVFHPTNAFFVLFFMLLIRGRDAITGAEETMSMRPMFAGFRLRWSTKVEA